AILPNKVGCESTAGKLMGSEPNDNFAERRFLFFPNEGFSAESNFVVEEGLVGTVVEQASEVLMVVGSCKISRDASLEPCGNGEPLLRGHHSIWEELDLPATGSGKAV
ncbi:MAG: hypothetical protein ACREIF_02580, partial [Chthoniobacterales bacterium]